MTLSFRPTEHSNAPIIALHSSASNSSQWSRLDADFGGRFDVYAFDLPGCGRAPLASDNSRKGAACSAAPVIEEIEKMGSPVHLVGHSNGGGIAIKVALMRPDLVKSLTVYEPATFHFLKDGDSTDQRLFKQIQFISALVTVAAEENVPTGMRHFIDFWNGEGFWDRLSLPARQKFADAIYSTMADFAHGFAETWELADLSKLEMPSLVLTGLESPEITQHVSAAIAKALPNARIALLPELGHMAPVFDPEWVNSRIFEHVANVERPTATCSWPIMAAA
ncbi:alpha/beta hydrolase [Sulfitobacter sp. SK012]|uniref:alpha/beta fold hydrolase n=1 Tax=Sulfitobacter sp. SK012 TaxID=1389005 RepID=UPI000E0A43B9|nr:alpha/beta hydrolase [Sulfitobacter sp. SK012]AXI45619.1 alpha/beta hydrolase [Sulfitobacter sp. SK012]